MKVTTVCIFMVMTLFVGGCGIKPGQVEAPDTLEQDHFPRTYPDPATDLDYGRYTR